MILPPLNLDGASELLRCSNLERGWEVVMEHVDEPWDLPAPLAGLADDWDRSHPDERSDPKLALRSVRSTPDGRLLCRMQSTTWRTVRALHEGPPRRDSELLTCNADGCDFLLPNIAVVHVVVTTADGWVLTFRRGEHSHYHPGRWSATYEEGLAPEDLSNGGVLQNTSYRGLIEELGVQDVAIPTDAFRVLSVVLERPIGNPAIVVAATLPLKLGDLTTRCASDELDVSSLRPVRLEAEALSMAIAGAPIESQSPRAEWHPTARYRLLIALARAFGENAAAEVWRRITEAGAFPSVVRERKP